MALVAEWTFDNDDHAGSVALDTLASLALPVNAWDATGRYGHGSDITVVTSPVQVVTGSAASIALWADLTQAGHHAMGALDVGEHRIWFEVGQSSFQFGFTNSTFQKTHYANDASAATPAWHHIVLAFDGSDVRLYLDGVDQTPRTGNFTGTEFWPAMVGNRSGIDAGANLPLAPGSLRLDAHRADSARVFDHALTGATVVPQPPLPPGIAQPYVVDGVLVPPALALPVDGAHIDYSVPLGPYSPGQTLAVTATWLNGGIVWDELPAGWVRTSSTTATYAVTFDDVEVPAPSSNALASLDELKNRLDFTLDVQEEALALSGLEDASNLVRAEGLPWTAQNVPPVVKTIVLQATRRYVVNNQGLTVSRAGDETLGWDGIGDKAGTVYLTNEEKRTVITLSRGATFGSIPVTAWGTRKGAADRYASYVPVAGWPDERPFPFFGDETEPW